MSSRTPITPVMRNGPSPCVSPRLSKAEIDEILDSPYETNYTYSDSIAYMPHIGSHDYVHPRLCRRFPAQLSHSLPFIKHRSISVNGQQQFFGKSCFFLILLLLLLVVGHELYDKQSIGNDDQIHGNTEKNFVEFHQHTHFAHPCTPQKGLIVADPSYLTKSNDEVSFPFPKFVNNTTQFANSQSLWGPIDSIAYYERFVVQFLFVDYSLFEGFKFYNVSVSVSHLHF